MEIKIFQIFLKLDMNKLERLRKAKVGMMQEMVYFKLVAKK